MSRGGKLGKITMKPILFALISLLAGFLGGILGARAARTGENSTVAPVIRARKFELVDETGRPISYWGIDQDHQAVLAFGWYVPGMSDRSPQAPPSAPGGLENPLNQYARFGVIGSLPLLELQGDRGQTRMALNLMPPDKPVLTMRDERGTRLFLGVLLSDTPLAPENNDWGLSFEPDRAMIGMLTGEVNGQKYVRGVLNVDKDDVILPHHVPAGLLERPRKPPTSHR